MEAFIHKEAQEKAKEIRLKADEEYEIEKSQIVRTEIAAIDDVYGQKLKKASLAQQITKSTITNKSRLRVLSKKEEVLLAIFNEAEKDLKELSKKKGQYKPILTGLIEEGLLMMLEKDVRIVLRKQDLSLGKEAVADASRAFEEKSKFPVNAVIDEENFLSADSSGGAKIIGGSGRIELDNTLEQRLRILSEEALPGIRLELFGPSKSRKFFN